MLVTVTIIFLHTILIPSLSLIIMVLPIQGMLRLGRLYNDGQKEPWESTLLTVSIMAWYISCVFYVS